MAIVLPLSNEMRFLGEPPPVLLDTCLCGHARGEHAPHGSRGCEELGCRCAAYAWERPSVELYVLAGLIVDARHPRCAYYLHALHVDQFCFAPYRAIAAALIRLRDQPRRWPRPGYGGAWRRVALELRVRGGQQGRALAAAGWPHAVYASAGTASGIGWYFSRLVEHNSRRRQAPVRRGEVGEAG